jgi:hypothetical protein
VFWILKSKTLQCDLSMGHATLQGSAANETKDVQTFPHTTYYVLSKFAWKSADLELLCGFVAPISVCGFSPATAVTCALDILPLTVCSSHHDC